MNSIKKLILKRENKKLLSFKDFSFLVKNYSNNNITDLEMTTFLKNVFLNELSSEEILNWFEAILNDTEKIDFSCVKGFKMDKHSTGGVGDNITLILLPLLASFGIKVFKLSGDSLGHTGGTTNKLNSFKGIDLKISKKNFLKKAFNNNKLILGAIMTEISSFERKLYSLRTKTKTTKSVSLIFISIMIKKIFLEVDALIMDIKFGSGSLFKTNDEIKIFSFLITKLAKKYNRKLIITITNMNQPLGVSIGNKNEVIEAIKILEGGPIPEDLKEIIIEQAAHALILSNHVKNLTLAKKMVKDKLYSGQAISEFKTWIENQGGDFNSIYNNRILNCKNKISIKAKQDGFVVIKNNSEVGNFLNKINNSLSGITDTEAGIEWFKKNNFFVKKGDEVFIFYTNNENIEELKKRANNLFIISSKKIKTSPIIIKTIVSK